eukprot:CAMPEP_0167741940 /NCGR_PEP_ID=MMETSP0110_2-20121227/1139_1 /TAXON_ID=629695 /ORGANISM="Gymnochlora sp., Strain CCMP2014" /LENGTH=505 /DNA_ID=CAMNT_0007626055 /DNA_START=887 /DNA_END=2404 /DNA_ORIENTATION=+
MSGSALVDKKNKKDSTGDEDSKRTTFHETKKKRSRSIHDGLLNVSNVIRGAYLKELGIYQLMGLSTTTDAEKVYAALQEQREIGDDESSEQRLSSERKDIEVEVLEKKQTKTGAYLTLMKAFVGIGILAVPGAVAEAGYILGSLFLVLIAWVSYYCSLLLLNCKDIVLERRRAALAEGKLESSQAKDLPAIVTFQDLGFLVGGQSGKLAVEISLVISQMSFVCAYYLFIGQMISLAIDKSGFVNSKMFWTILSCIASIPLVYIKSVKNLVFPAIFADIIIVFGILTVIVYDFLEIDTVHENVEAFRFGGLPLFFGIAVFAFEGIGMVLPVAQSMENQKEFPSVLRHSFIHLLVALIIIGALSYSAYGGHTKNPILLSLPRTPFVTSIMLLYCFALYCTVPIQMFPATNILEKYSYFNTIFRGNIYVHRFVVVLVVGLIASVIPNFGLFLNVIGAVTGTMIAFILPTYLYMKITNNFKQLLPMSALIFGAVGGFIAFVMSLVEFSA